MTRVRPNKKNESDNFINCNSDKNYICINDVKKDIMNKNIETNKKYEFDQVYDQDYDNDDIFNDFGIKIAFNLIKKIDTTFYVYGQTGSGKTYTIMGNEKVPGILSLILKIFKKQNLDLKINCIQIYNNKCLDILNNNYQIFEREDANGKIHLINVRDANLKYESVDSIITTIKRNRQVGISNQNSASSRSHLFIRIKNGPNFLNILDLAGSEKAKDSVYVNKSTFRENAEINKSILALKECIRSLKNNNSHVPYRESKLTKILKDSFELRTQTYVLATISPEKENISDSINTLNYISDMKYLKPKILESPKLPTIKTDKMKKTTSTPTIKKNVNLPYIQRNDSVPNKFNDNNSKYPNIYGNIPKIPNYEKNPYYQNLNLYSNKRYERNPYGKNHGLSPKCKYLINNRFKIDNLSREKDRVLNLIVRRRTSNQNKTKLISIIDDEINLLSQLKKNIR